MSNIAIHINPLPPVFTSPPHERVVSDSVGALYKEGGWGGVILSNSVPDLQWYQGVVPQSNATTGTTVAMSWYHAHATLGEIRDSLHQELERVMTTQDTNQSVDMLRLDNVTNACDLLETLLSRGGGGGGGGLPGPPHILRGLVWGRWGGGGGGLGARGALRVSRSILSWLCCRCV